MKKLINSFKKFISYLLCLSCPRELARVINEAASVDELDDAVLEEAGVFR